MIQGRRLEVPGGATFDLIQWRHLSGSSSVFQRLPRCLERKHLLHLAWHGTQWLCMIFQTQHSPSGKTEPSGAIIESSSRRYSRTFRWSAVIAHREDWNCLQELFLEFILRFFAAISPSSKVMYSVLLSGKKLWTERAIWQKFIVFLLNPETDHSAMSRSKPRLLYLGICFRQCFT